MATTLLLVALAPVHAQSLLAEVQSAQEQGGSPAVAAVTVRCGGEPNVAVAGVSRLDEPARLREDASFNIGSNAKSMLASLAGTYVQDGKLRWTTTVGDVLGADLPGLDKDLARATLAQLLSHRSGLAGFDTGQALRQVEVRGDTASAQRMSFARQVLSAPPAYPVGSKFVYSNAGYVVASVMLERTGGKPFEALMQERLFRPLGMSAGFGNSMPPAPSQPWGHHASDGKQKVHDDTDPVIPPFLQAAGDVVLGMADYGRYLREHLCGLRGEPTRVLSNATIRAMHAPQGPDQGGMGWGSYELGGSPASVHVGGTGTFSAFVAVQAERNLAVATVTNTGMEAGRSATLGLLRRLAGAVEK